MKNIHVLPTEKPSRLWMTKLGNLTRCHDIKPIKEALGNNVNIYITNDSEIKEGDWFTDSNNSLKTSYKLSHVQFANPKKIILTTDDLLIKDGVQAIDDEFLEWFVKNPSCEEVEIVEGDIINGKYTFGKYRIRRMYYADEPKEEPKQETLEEAEKEFEKLLNGKGLPTKQLTEVAEHYFISGYEIAKERSYSEEEVIQTLIKFNQEIHEVEDVREWFKKK